MSKKQTGRISPDIYYVIRNYRDGIPALADACQPVVSDPSANHPQAAAAACQRSN